MIFRIQALYQHLLFVFMGKRHDLVRQGAYLVVLAHLHIPQLAVEEIGQGPFQAAHFKLCAFLILFRILYQFSRNILL